MILTLAILPIEGDDPDFVTLVENVVGRVIETSEPRDLFVIRTKGWFDWKWLRFSGKRNGVGIHKQDRLNIPPFTPARILTQETYSMDSALRLYRPVENFPLHWYQESSDNLCRFIDRVSDSEIFVWFSGGSAKGDDASMMVYHNFRRSQDAWYASFHRHADWRLRKVNGISAAEFESLRGPAVAAA